MSDYRRQLEEFAKRRGWDVTSTNGGHLRMTHDRVPLAIVHASSTPGDIRSLRNVIASIKRAERTAGIEDDVLKTKKEERAARRRRTFENFELKAVNSESNDKTLIVRCSRCTATDELFRGAALSRASHSPSTIAKLFISRGWRANESREQDLCPQCYSEDRAKAISMKLNSEVIAMPEYAPPTADTDPTRAVEAASLKAVHAGSVLVPPPSAPAVEAASPAMPQAVLDERRKRERRILHYLAQFYIEEAGYDGQTDATIAALAQAGEDEVALLRDMYYGPAQASSVPPELRRRVDSLKADLNNVLGRLTQDLIRITDAVDELDKAIKRPAPKA